MRCAAHLVALEGANPVATPALTQHGLAIFARASKEIAIGGDGTAQHKPSTQCSLEGMQRCLSTAYDAFSCLAGVARPWSRNSKPPKARRACKTAQQSVANARGTQPLPGSVCSYWYRLGEHAEILLLYTQTVMCRGSQVQHTKQTASIHRRNTQDPLPKNCVKGSY